VREKGKEAHNTPTMFIRKGGGITLPNLIKINQQNTSSRTEK